MRAIAQQDGTASKSAQLTRLSNRGIFVGSSFVFESKSEISNTVHIASFASIFHAYGIPDFGKS
ncbi:hypothetical protein ACTOV4_17200, partial [Brucella sp. C7-11G]